MIDLSELVFDKEKILSDIGEIEVEEEGSSSGKATIGQSPHE